MSGPPNTDTAAGPVQPPTVLTVPSIVIVAPTPSVILEPTPSPSDAVESPTPDATSSSPYRSKGPTASASLRYVPPAPTDPTALPAIDCAQRSGLKSNDGNATQITFHNARANTVTIQWIDYDGNLQDYGTLGAGQEYVQDTYVTHLWLISDATGACLGIYAAASYHGTVVIR
jgi:hypothetical protein